ncbi:hypothetical protein [Alkalihalobacillus deserti]|uniref:hypothetical protein n=1 Tax=Alkalihalobacillus deserti TaxID=2879466 RepID=UPI001D15BBE3|nr:hypothetical protein [Alkalihalobacillus deserti]
MKYEISLVEEQGLHCCASNDKKPLVVRFKRKQRVRSLLKDRAVVFLSDELEIL